MAKNWTKIHHSRRARRAAQRCKAVRQMLRRLGEFYFTRRFLRSATMHIAASAAADPNEFENDRMIRNPEIVVHKNVEP